VPPLEVLLGRLRHGCDRLERGGLVALRSTDVQHVRDAPPNTDGTTYLDLGVNTLATLASVLGTGAFRRKRWRRPSVHRGGGHDGHRVLPPLGGRGGRRDVTGRTLGAMTKSVSGAALILHGIGKRYRLGRSGGLVSVPLFGNRLDRLERDCRRDVEDDDSSWRTRTMSPTSGVPPARLASCGGYAT
jgi:hypothetical protein